jgi:hypothetical protein
MKNYEKIYKKLVKHIKKELDAHMYLKNNTYNANIEDEYGIQLLTYLLEILPEIEGKKCHMITMNQEEFKQWKEEITK